MWQKGCCKVVLFNAATIVSNSYAAYAAVFNLDANVFRACVNTVFNKFFDY